MDTCDDLNAPLDLPDKGRPIIVEDFFALSLVAGCIAVAWAVAGIIAFFLVTITGA